MTSAADANEMVQNLLVTLTSAINLYGELASQEIAEGTEGTRKIVRDMRSEIDALRATNEGLIHNALQLQERNNQLGVDNAKLAAESDQRAKAFENRGSEINRQTEIIKRLGDEKQQLAAEVRRLGALREGDRELRIKAADVLDNVVPRLQGELDAARAMNEQLIKENARLRQGLPTGVLALEEHMLLKNVAVAARSIIEAEVGTVEEELADAELERCVEALLSWHENNPDYQS